MHASVLAFGCILAVSLQFRFVASATKKKPHKHSGVLEVCLKGASSNSLDQP